MFSGLGWPFKDSEVNENIGKGIGKNPDHAWAENP
jgi:hypothetical protein